jgi:putative ABC transport system permease protein
MRLKVKAGDEFTIETADGKQGRFVLTGVAENYVGAYCYIAPDLYEDAFETRPACRMLLAITNVTGVKEQDAFTQKMLSQKNVVMVSFTSQTQAMYTSLLGSINLVVIFIIIASGLLAMLVIYNLTNINISERTREIATLRVLGFYHSEAAAYIFREIAVLSVIGVLCGLVLGIPLHNFMAGVAERTDLMFGRNIAPQSFAFSAFISLGFSFLVDLLMLPKLHGVKMAESMKAVE